MATLSVAVTDHVRLEGDGSVYTDVRDNFTASRRFHNNSTLLALGQQLLGLKYYIYRTVVRFDISELPVGVAIQAATLKLYGDTDWSDTDFDIIITSGRFYENEDSYQFYWRHYYGDDSWGTKNTSTCSTGAYNDITINSTGLTDLTAQQSSGYIILGLRSSRDIDNEEPVGRELYSFDRDNGANPPTLEIEYYAGSGDEHPLVPTFPDNPTVDLDLYALISNYLTGIDRDLSAITDGSGNIDLSEDAAIQWEGTGEQISFDSGNTWVEITSLESTSVITLDGDLTTANMAIVTTLTAVDSDVAGNGVLSNTAYASVKSKVTDDEMRYAEVVATSPADEEADLYMDEATGDFMLKTRDDAQAGTKTATLADFDTL